MAENRLETKILLRYATYNSWMNSSVILRAGETAVAAFPDPDPNEPPRAVGIKIGDGKHYFDELPWIQAIASDVYSWAKNSTKPTYSATEIEGLQAFVEQYGGGSGSGPAIAGSAYRLIYDNNTNRYILQYYSEEQDDWIDTASNVDLSSILKRLNDLERFANGEQGNLGNIEYPLMSFIYEGILTYLNRLTVDDTPVANEFVTSVSETQGKIEVTRRALTTADITSGVFSTAQGGTGLTSVDADELLGGSINGDITKKTIATNLNNASNSDIPTSGAVISYVTNATAGLTGAMHFVGEAAVIITPNSHTDPQIQNYNFNQAQPGDVILANNAQEFVWTGGIWRLLGDEGSYAIKGSITNTDIAADANIAQSKIADLSETFATKVDKEEGKTLTSNDFTDELYEKLTNIDTDAQVNAIEHIYLNGEEVRPSTIQDVSKVVNLEINEFDENAQQKLRGIEDGAEVNKIEKITYDGTEIVPDINKVVHIISNPHTEHENKIEQIFINGTEWVPNQQKQVQITIDQAALNLNVLEGATIPNGMGGTEDVTQIAKKLELERIAVTGNVKDLHQYTDTYIVLDCGSSTEVV